MHEHHDGMLPVVDSVDVAHATDVHKLHGGAIGLWGVLFLTVTGSAPISAMLLQHPDLGGLRQRHRHTCRAS